MKLFLPPITSTKNAFQRIHLRFLTRFNGFRLSGNEFLFMAAPFMEKRLILTLILLPLLLLACAPQPTLTSSIQPLSALFDKKWIFQYALENGEKTMTYQHLLDKEIWITFSSQLYQEKPCEDIFDAQNISSDSRCFSGYDGCNDFWGIYSIAKDGKFDVQARYSELVGCPVQIETQEAGFSIGPEIYNSDPFTHAFGSVVRIEANVSELKLYYPSTQQNYLLFHLEETP